MVIVVSWWLIFDLEILSATSMLASIMVFMFGVDASRSSDSKSLGSNISR